jgi:hypothetical protein
MPRGPFDLVMLSQLFSGIENQFHNKDQKEFELELLNFFPHFFVTYMTDLSLIHPSWTAMSSCF